MLVIGLSITTSIRIVVMTQRIIIASNIFLKELIHINKLKFFVPINPR